MSGASQAKSLIFRLFADLRAMGWSQFDPAIPEEAFGDNMDYGDLDLEGKRMLINLNNLLGFALDAASAPDFIITFTRRNGTMKYTLATGDAAEVHRQYESFKNEVY